MATSTSNGIYGYETPLFAPSYGEAPSFYQNSKLELPEHKEIRVPMYDTEAAATGLPIYMGGTVSSRCIVLVETEPGV